MQDQVNNIEKKVDKMYEAMVGNEFNEGLIAEVKKNSSHRKNAMKTNGFVAGAAIIFGGLISQIWGMVSSIFSS